MGVFVGRAPLAHRIGATIAEEHFRLFFRALDEALRTLELFAFENRKSPLLDDRRIFRRAELDRRTVAVGPFELYRWVIGIAILIGNRVEPLGVGLRNDVVGPEKLDLGTGAHDLSGVVDVGVVGNLDDDLIEPLGHDVCIGYTKASASSTHEDVDQPLPNVGDLILLIRLELHLVGQSNAPFHVQAVIGRIAREEECRNDA